MEKRDLGVARGNKVLRPLMANLYLAVDTQYGQAPTSRSMQTQIRRSEVANPLAAEVQLGLRPFQGRA